MEKNKLIKSRASLQVRKEYIFLSRVQGHAYAILDVKETSDKKHKLVKIRNPWGTFEWKGMWSDGSKSWTTAYRKEMGATSADDGIFWMSFQDFIVTFDKISLCRLFNDLLLTSPHASNVPVDKSETNVSFSNTSWYRAKIQGNWNGKNAGGMLCLFAHCGNRPVHKQGCVYNESTFKVYCQEAR